MALEAGREKHVVQRGAMARGRIPETLVPQGFPGFWRQVEEKLYFPLLASLSVPRRRRKAGGWCTLIINLSINYLLGKFETPKPLCRKAFRVFQSEWKVLLSE